MSSTTAKQATAQAPPAGVNFPVGSNGRVSTTDTGKAVWNVAIGAAGSEGTGSDELCKAILGERNWRHRYNEHLIKYVDISMQSPGIARAVADSGLAAVRDTFLFRQGAGSEPTPLSEAMAVEGRAFATGTIQGSGKLAVQDASQLSFGTVKGQPLVGEAIVAYLQRVAEYGACEADVPASVQHVLQNGTALRETLDETAFVLIGATSALGPAQTLLDLGATVVAVSRKGSKLRDMLLQRAAASPATVIVPMLSPAADDSNEAVAAAAGADVLTDAPALVEWLAGVAPGKRLVIGNYIYLDSEAHVRASVAMEMIVAGVSERRPDTALA